MLVKNYKYYLDHAATTPDLTILSTTSDQGGLSWCNRHDWANPNSVHKPGIAAYIQLAAAELRIKDYIHASGGCILWTGSGSQANNLAIQTICKVPSELVTTAIEHKSVLQHTQEETKVIYPNRHGVISTFDILATLLDHRPTNLVSIQMVNNETGVRQDIRSIGTYLKNKHPDIIFHTDAVQAFGKLKIDVEELKVDMLSFSAHKFYGPKGLAGLWISKECQRRISFPYQGTPPAELISRWALFLRHFSTDIDDDILVEKDHIFYKMLIDSKVEFEKTISNSRLVGLFSLHFPGVDAIDLMQTLSDKEVYVSTGSACNSEDIKPSHVLTVMGIPEEQIKSTIRVSLGRAVTLDQCQKAAVIIAETVKELKNGS